MGHSWSSRRRRNNHQSLLEPHNPPLPAAPPPTSSSSTPPPPLPSSSSSSNTISEALSPPLPPPRPPTFAFAANAPFHTPQNNYHTLPPPAPPSHLSSYSQQSNSYNPYSYTTSSMSRSNCPPFYWNHSNGWSGFRPPVAPQQRPPPYVDHQNAKKIKNDVNVHKDTIRIEVDQNNPDYQLVSFTFDALVDGSITIFYFAKEGQNCTFTPSYPEIYMPKRITFEKGLGQKFLQPPGTGIDLGFFDINELSKPSPNEEIFPLIIFAEFSSTVVPSGNQLGEPLSTTPSNAQITQAVLEKNDVGAFQVRVIKQILWVNGTSYELREIYGIGASDEISFDNSGGTGKECVICMTEPKDTAVLPCRHMCMCSECAKALRLQSKKCPICRQPIQELMEIKVD